VTRGQLPQRAGSLGLTAVGLPPRYPRVKEYLSHPVLIFAHLILGLLAVVNDNNVTTATVVTKFPRKVHSLQQEHSNQLADE